MRLLFVVPRYGADIAGGAERLVRDHALRLAERGHEVTVHTTCARDHARWLNELRPGIERDGQVTVHRHPVAMANLHVRARLQLQIDNGFRLTAAEEDEWLHESGHSDPLLEAVWRQGADVDAIIFAPYLFPTTVYGARLHPERSLIIPCLHDEPYARFSAVQSTLLGCAGIFFNSQAESRLAAELMHDLPPSLVIGAGFDAVAADPNRFLRRHPVRAPYIVYAGRRERGKNFPLLLEWTVAHNEQLRCGVPVTLLALGSGDAPQLPLAAGHVHDAGFVDSISKHDALAGSVAAANLSLNESFSYVLMEAWLSGTVGVVHAECPVTREHCEESGGGLWVASAEEYSAALDRLSHDAALHRRLAEAGRRYVLERFSWAAVTDRLEAGLAQLCP